VYGALTLVRGRHQRLKLHCITDLSKELVGDGDFNTQEEQAMLTFLQGHKIKENLIDRLLETTPATALEVAHKHLSAEERLEVARYIFPLVYTGDGIITDTDRRRFRRVCSQLELPDDHPGLISHDYRQRLDRQWQYLSALVKRLNYFTLILQLNNIQINSLKEQLNELLHFDPRRATAERRAKLLATLNGQPKNRAEPISTDPLDTASLIGAYSLMHTVAIEPDRRRHLTEAFTTLVEGCPGLGDKDQHSLQDSRERIDNLYEHTHDRIKAATRKDS
jgi:hypothetical protein